MDISLQIVYKFVTVKDETLPCWAAHISVTTAKATVGRARQGSRPRFKVFGMTQQGCNPRVPDCEANAPTYALSVTMITVIS